MKITKEWLKEKHACSEGYVWFIGQEKTDSNKIIRSWIEKKEHLDWGNWLIVRTMKREQYVRYAIYAAEQVLYIFEDKYPDDSRPRDAIEAAKLVLNNNNCEIKNATTYATARAAYYAAAYAASDAAYAAYYAANAAYFADNAAYAAAYAANAAYYAAYYDADYATDYTACVAHAAKIKLQIKILEYGLSLLGGR